MAGDDDLLDVVLYGTAAEIARAVRHDAMHHLDRIAMDLRMAEHSLDVKDEVRARAAITDAGFAVSELAAVMRQIKIGLPPRGTQSARVNLARAFEEAAAAASGWLLAADATVVAATADMEIETNPDVVHMLFLQLLTLTCLRPRRPMRTRRDTSEIRLVAERLSASRSRLVYTDEGAVLDGQQISELLERGARRPEVAIVRERYGRPGWTALVITRAAAALGATVSAMDAPRGACIEIEIPDRPAPSAAVS